MTTPGGHGPLFQVSYPGTVRQTLADLHQKAQRVGLASQFLAALHTIDERLQQDPLTFGDINYHLTVFEVRVAVVPPLVVHFGVDKTSHHVLVSGVMPLPGSTF